jgi:hypothetical protein
LGEALVYLSWQVKYVEKRPECGANSPGEGMHHQRVPTAARLLVKKLTKSLAIARNKQQSNKRELLLGKNANLLTGEESHGWQQPREMFVRGGTSHFLSWV